MHVRNKYSTHCAHVRCYNQGVQMIQRQQMAANALQPGRTPSRSVRQLSRCVAAAAAAALTLYSCTQPGEVTAAEAAVVALLWRACAAEWRTNVAVVT
jgi:hypothetical protein